MHLHDPNTWPTIPSDDPHVRAQVERFADQHEIAAESVHVRGILPGTYPHRPTYEAYAFSVEPGLPLHSESL